MIVAESLASNPSTVSVAPAVLAAPVNPAALADLAASGVLTDRCVFRNGMAVIKGKILRATIITRTHVGDHVLLP